MVDGDDVEVWAVEAGIDHSGGRESVSTARRRTGRGRGTGQDTRLSQITADRPIFTLSVAADLLGLHPRTLRIYEEKKLVLPARTEGNRRRYSQNDIQRFQFIRRLTAGGVNLEGVRVILDMADELARLGADPDAIIERNLHDMDQDVEEE
jgi:MerR family transcriptional regulator/heat shock protein HspR